MMWSGHVYSSAQQRRCHAPRCATRPPSSRMFTRWPLSVQEALQASYTASAMINTSRQIFITALRKQITDAAPKAVIFLSCFIALLGWNIQWKLSTAKVQLLGGIDSVTIESSDFLIEDFPFPQSSDFLWANLRGLSQQNAQEMCIPLMTKLWVDLQMTHELDINLQDLLAV